MAVPSWKRTISKVEYIRKIFELNKDLARINGKIPKKYARTYGDWLVKAGFDALLCAQKANSIFIFSKDTYIKRRQYFNELKAYLNSISAISFIALELLRDANAGIRTLPNGDIVPSKESEKITKWQDKIGIKCAEIKEMINKICEYDRKIYNKNVKAK